VRSLAHLPAARNINREFDRTFTGTRLIRVHFGTPPKASFDAKFDASFASSFEASLPGVPAT
jgi:hypothetical protein